MFGSVGKGSTLVLLQEVRGQRMGHFQSAKFERERVDVKEDEDDKEVEENDKEEEDEEEQHMSEERTRPAPPHMMTGDLMFTQPTPPAIRHVLLVPL